MSDRTRAPGRGIGIEIELGIVRQSGSCGNRDRAAIGIEIELGTRKREQGAGRALRPTMSDVAAAASVSTSTVSRALSGDTRVKEATRRYIEQVASDLGYIPNRTATALRRGRTWMIGVATPGTPRGFSDPFYLEFLGGLGDGAIRAGYNLVIAAPTAIGLDVDVDRDREPDDYGDVDRDHDCGDHRDGHRAGASAGTAVGAGSVTEIRSARSGHVQGGARGMDLEGLVAHGAVDALALTEPAVDDPRLSVLRRYSVPFAFLGTCEEGGDVAEGVSYVDGDNVGGSREAVEHLIRLGHRRIACLAGAAGLVSTRHRLLGYYEAMQRAGLPVDAAWVVDGDSTKQGGRKAMQTLLASGLGRGGPTAVFACNDLMAVGALRAAREAGLSVPGDVSIVGFDGIPLSELVEPALTTVQQPIYELGRYLADVLLGQLEHSGTSRTGDSPETSASLATGAAPESDTGTGAGTATAIAARGGRDVEARFERKIVPCRLVVRGSTAPPLIM